MGGWFTVENKLRPMSYHKDLQTLTVPLTNKGNIYLSDFLVGSMDKTLPEKFIEELLVYTRKSLPSTLLNAMVLFGSMGGQYQSADKYATITMQFKFALILLLWWSGIIKRV